MKTPDDLGSGKPAEVDESRPGAVYTPRQKTTVRKSGEAATGLGTGASGITALHGVAPKFLDEEATRGDVVLSVAVIAAGVPLIGLGIYLHSEAER